MSPLDRYKKWCAENPERFQNAQDFAQVKMGWTLPDIRERLRQIDVWLEANAGNKKANKRNWYKFVLNWLCRSFPQKPREIPYWKIPEDKPRRVGGNSEPQSVGDILNRIMGRDR